MASIAALAAPWRKPMSTSPPVLSIRCCLARPAHLCQAEQKRLLTMARVGAESIRTMNTVQAINRILSALVGPRTIFGLGCMPFAKFGG